MILRFLSKLLTVILFPYWCSGQCITPDRIIPIDKNVCEGDTFIALGGVYMSNEVYGIVHSNPFCYYEETYNQPNQADFNIEGEGLVDFIKTPKKNDYNQDLILIEEIKFKAIRTTTITITDVYKGKTTFDGEKCINTCENYGGKTIYIINVKVAPKKAPTLTSSKAVVQADKEPVSFQVSGCDRDYYWGVYSFQPSCEEPKPLPDTRGPGETIEGFSRDLIISKSLTYYVRCTNNNCYSDWSEAAHVDVIPTNNPCNNPIVDQINSIQESKRKDFHYYKVETSFCNVSEANCTRQKIYDLMLSSKMFTAPIASDMAPGLPTDLGKIGTIVSVLGSKAIFASDISKVEDCKNVNLPGAQAIGLNSAAFMISLLSHSPRPFTVTRYATANVSSLANPILQFTDAQSYSLFNYTLPGHFLYPGRVFRQVVEDCDKIKVVTIGIGNSLYGDNFMGGFIAYLNENFGSDIFKKVDSRLLNVYNSLPK